MTTRAEELLRARGQRGASACIAGVATGGEHAVVSWSPCGTPAGANTVLEIGSLTKAFTGALLADMQASGDVDLADPLGRYLPAAERLGPHVAAITLEELATHRSGLPNTPRGMLAREIAFATGVRRDDPWSGVDERTYHDMIRRSAGRRHGRGRAVRYSSVGFGLLGDALAARAGRPFGELLRERLLDPLALHATAVGGSASLPGRSRRGRLRAQLDDMMPAAGMLRSTASDMLRWLDACRQPPNVRPGPALALAQRPRVRVGRHLALGLGWLVDRHPARPPTVWHNGATYGFRSFAAFVPQRDVAVVVLSNGTRSVDRLGFDLVRLALEPGERSYARLTDGGARLSDR